MIRRINWSLGDSRPAHGTMTVYVSGTGTLYLPTGFAVSSAIVTFTQNYSEVISYSEDYYYYSNDVQKPKIYVGSLDSGGFNVEYENIPEYLEFSYYAQ